MDIKKDVRFSEKKVDENWKEHTSPDLPQGEAPRSKKPETSRTFLNLMQSLGFQALIGLGLAPAPGTDKLDPNFELAKETIDTLVALRDKTAGNLSEEEKKFVDGLISELQVKFAQLV